MSYLGQEQEWFLGILIYLVLRFFFQHFNKFIKEKEISVVVYTIRLDDYIKKLFIDSGLPRKNYLTKEEGANLKVFSSTIQSALGEK